MKIENLIEKYENEIKEYALKSIEAFICHLMTMNYDCYSIFDKIEQRYKLKLLYNGKEKIVLDNYNIDNIEEILFEICNTTAKGQGIEID